MSRPSKQTETGSPFFHPHTPRLGPPRDIVTPGGTKRREAPKVQDEERKATQLGTVFNFVNQIVGCGIVGIPFAVNESGIAAGIFLILLSAYLTRKSLHLLLETARHIDAPTYEVLAEAAFGRPGFLAVSGAMFILSYGSMVSYLMVVRDTLPPLLGISYEEKDMKRLVMVLISAVTMFPLSAQRDMADLAKTSAISVTFDVLMVAIVCASANEAAGVQPSISNEEIVMVRPETIFVGLGVLSFAFVCQHSGFLISGSLRNPTNRRLRRVTFMALALCAALAITIGIAGYLTFRDETRGDVLNNFPQSWRTASVARGLLCSTMFFVYPMESFVARHVTVVLLFQGRSAKEGDDHAVLARASRRIALTLALYVLALIPALLFDELGTVLALTGAIGGSAMSYIGPGLCYLGIHGGSLLERAKEVWDFEDDEYPSREALKLGCDLSVAESGVCDLSVAESGGGVKTLDQPEDTRCSFIAEAALDLAWYILLMPLWISIARIGRRSLDNYQSAQALKSPYMNVRMGKAVRKQLAGQTGSSDHTLKLIPPKNLRGGMDDESEESEERKPLLRTVSLPKDSAVNNHQHPAYSGVTMNNHQHPAYSGVTIETWSVDATTISSDVMQEKEDDFLDLQDLRPSWFDFFVGASFFLFGLVALFAGVISIFV